MSAFDIYVTVALLFLMILFLLPAASVMRQNITKNNTVVFGVDMEQLPKDLKVTQKISWIRSQNHNLTQSQATTILAQWEGINQPK